MKVGQMAPIQVPPGQRPPDRCPLGQMPPFDVGLTGAFVQEGTCLEDTCLAAFVWGPLVRGASVRDGICPDIMVSYDIIWCHNWYLVKWWSSEMFMQVTLTLLSRKSLDRCMMWECGMRTHWTRHYANSIATSGSSVAPLSFDAWNENVRLMIAETQPKKALNYHKDLREKPAS